MKIITRVTVFLLILALLENFAVEAQQNSFRRQRVPASVARLRNKFNRGGGNIQRQQGNRIQRQQGNGNGNVGRVPPEAILIPLGLLAAAVVVPAGILLLSGFVNGGTAATSGVSTSLTGAMTGVTTTLTGGKKRRRRNAANQTNQQDQIKLLQQMSVLQSYLDIYGTGEEDEIHENMVAKYMVCSRNSEEDLLLPCLEKLMCVFHDKTVNMDKQEREVASAVLDSIMSNKFVDPLFKKALRLAYHTGLTYPGSCQKYKCKNNFVTPKNRSQEHSKYMKP